MNRTERLDQLTKAVIKTEHIDESGDASFGTYMSESIVFGKGYTLEELLEDYLDWASGSDWVVFLSTAQVGDVPRTM